MRNLAFAVVLALSGAFIYAAPAAAADTPTLNIGVQNPGPGGGTGPAGSPPGGTIRPQNAVPVLTGLSPTTATSGAGFTLVLTGNNFSATSVINFGAVQLSPTANTATSLTAVVPASAMLRGPVAVSVSNPPPGGGTSAVVAFQVAAPPNPAPAIAGVSPTSLNAGSGATTVTATGSGFISGTTASLGGVHGVVAGGTITFALTASVLLNPGSLSGLISNPAPGGGTASFTVNVLNALPTVASFSPTSANAGIATLSIAVTGTQFRSGSSVTLDGTPVPTTFVSSTSLTATIAEGFLRSSGTLAVGVANPSPGGGSAAASGLFTVRNPSPVLSGVSPARLVVTKNSAQVSLTGTGFAGNSAAAILGTTLATVANSPTSLTVTIPAQLLGKAATLAITVTNPPPGGGTSGPASLIVLSPAPLVASLLPSNGTANTSMKITISGSNFVDGAILNVGGAPVATTFVNANTLTATILIPAAGVVNVTVTNPGVPASNSVVFQSR